MGEADDNGEAGIGGCRSLFTVVAGEGSGGSDMNSMVLAGGMRAEGADSFCKSLLAR